VSKLFVLASFKESFAAFTASFSRTEKTGTSICSPKIFNCSIAAGL